MKHNPDQFMHHSARAHAYTHTCITQGFVTSACTCTVQICDSRVDVGDEAGVDVEAHTHHDELFEALRKVAQVLQRLDEPLVEQHVRV